MSKELERLIVIFRTYEHEDDEEAPPVFRDVIALYPYEPADVYGQSCQSFQRVGQHSGANYIRVLEDTRPATAEEAEALQQLIEEMYNVTIERRYRRPSDATEVRRNKLGLEGPYEMWSEYGPVECEKCSRKIPYLEATDCPVAEEDEEDHPSGRITLCRSCARTYNRGDE